MPKYKKMKNREHGGRQQVSRVLLFSFSTGSTRLLFTTLVVFPFPSLDAEKASERREKLVYEISNQMRLSIVYVQS